jgi:hypothetical protein
MKNAIPDIAMEMMLFHASIGAPPRDAQKLWRDATLVNMVRNEGISVECLAMMATDYQFECTRLRQELERNGIYEERYNL